MSVFARLPKEKQRLLFLANLLSDDVAGGEVRPADGLDLRRPKCEKVRKSRVKRLNRWNLTQQATVSLTKSVGETGRKPGL